MRAFCESGSATFESVLVNCIKFVHREAWTHNREGRGKEGDAGLQAVTKAEVEGRKSENRPATVLSRQGSARAASAHQIRLERNQSQ